MNNEVTILLVDDDAGHRSLMRRNLSRSSVSNPIVEFEDGQLLLDHLKDERAAGNLSQKAFIIFLDIRMPKLSGVEVLRQLKNDSYLRRIPVIMVSTMDDPNEIARCHEIGCSHYVTKPVDYEQFITAVKSLGMLISIVKIPKLH